MKRQTEIPGAERPTIDLIDQAIIELAGIEEEIADLNYQREEARALVDQRIVEHMDELEKDEKGRPVYVFFDGGFQRPFVVHEKRIIKIGKKQRIKAEEE